MNRVGVRELRQRASELLRLVQGGETIEITDRGRPVALLGPIPAGALMRIRQSGESAPPSEDLDSLPEPIDLEDGQEPPSVFLGRLRASER